MRRALLFVCPWVMPLSLLQADTLLLKDGRIFDGVELERSESAVTVRFEHGDVSVPLEAVQECIIPGEVGFAPTNDEEREKLEKGLVRYRGEWIRPSQRDRAIAKLLAEQVEAIEELKGSRLWRNRKAEETENFFFEYTVPQHVFESYRDLMETYYQEFEKAWKIKRPKDVGKLQVQFYVDYEAFLQVTGIGRGVLGFFKFVEPYTLAVFYDRLDPRGTEEVIYHEVGHYLQKLIDVDFKYPHWPGEALSEFYAGSDWNPEKKQLTTGLVMEGRLSQMQLDIKNGEWVSIDEFLLGCQDRNFHDYSWGWSFVHFLMNHPKHQKNFKKFFLALAKDSKVDRYGEQFGPTTRLDTVSGEDMKKAFMKFMKLRKDEQLQELESEWRAYIGAELKVSSARGLEGAGRRAMRSGRKHRAKRLFEEAIATGEASSLAYFRLGEVLHELGESAAAQENWAKAIGRDPLVADYYIELGKSLLADEKTKDEGERMLGLALEIEPDNYYLERNMKRLLK